MLKLDFLANVRGTYYTGGYFLWTKKTRTVSSTQPFQQAKPAGNEDTEREYRGPNEQELSVHMPIDRDDLGWFHKGCSYHIFFHL